MKRFFSTMLILAAFAAVGCSESSSDTEDTDTYVGTKYTGTTRITATYNGNEGSFDSENTTIYLNVEDESVDLTLATACFTKDIPYVSSDYQMPSLDIVLPNIPVVYDTRYATDNLTATMLDGEPYGDDIIKSIDNVMVYIEEDIVTTSFDCTVYINLDGNGSADYTFNVAFTNGEFADDDSGSSSNATEYSGIYTSYKITDDSETLLYSDDDATFSVEYGAYGVATLVANDIYLGGGPTMTITITDIPLDSDNSYNYDSYVADTTAAAATSYGDTSVTINYAGFTISNGELSAMIEFVDNGNTYAVSFYNQD